jgi:hypothetical protein
VSDYDDWKTTEPQPYDPAGHWTCPNCRGDASECRCQVEPDACGHCDGEGVIVICPKGSEHRCEEIFCDTQINGECAVTCGRCGGSGDEPEQG